MNKNEKNGQNSVATSAVFERGINELTNEENSMLQEAIKDGYLIDEEDNEVEINEVHIEKYIDKAFLKSMSWFVNGKGVEVYLADKDGCMLDRKVWVEKQLTEKGLVYKFVLVINLDTESKKHSIEVSSSTWSDYDLFKGNMFSAIAREFAMFILKNEKEG